MVDGWYVLHRARKNIREPWVDATVRETLEGSGSNCTLLVYHLKRNTLSLKSSRHTAPIGINSVWSLGLQDSFLVRRPGSLNLASRVLRLWRLCGLFRQRWRIRPLDLEKNSLPHLFSMTYDLEDTGQWDEYLSIYRSSVFGLSAYRSWGSAVCPASDPRSIQHVDVSKTRGGFGIPNLKKDMVTIISRFYGAMRLTPDWKEGILTRRYVITHFNWSEDISNKHSQPPKCLILSGHEDTLDFSGWTAQRSKQTIVIRSR